MFLDFNFNFKLNIVLVNIRHRMRELKYNSNLKKKFMQRNQRIRSRLLKRQAHSQRRKVVMDYINVLFALMSITMDLKKLTFYFDNKNVSPNSTNNINQSINSCIVWSLLDQIGEKPNNIDQRENFFISDICFSVEIILFNNKKN